MKKMFYLIIIAVTLLLPACSFHFPTDWDGEYGYGNYSIVLKVNPDDAHVLLNGRFVGEAYEFSTQASALKLRSARNELVIKKEGFIEEEIDLDKYSMRKITIRLNLKNDMQVRRKPVAKNKIPPPHTKSEKYEVVKERDVPKGGSESVPVKVFSRLILEVTPSEASIYVDGEFWGIAPVKGIINNFNLRKGKHTIEVLKPGFKSARRTVDVKGSKGFKVKIKLEKK